MRRCVDTTTGQAYAVKVVPKRTHEGKDRAPFIAREVHMWRMLAALSPRVAGLQGAYQDANNIFLVQELLLDDMQKLLDQQVGRLSVLVEHVSCACSIPGLHAEATAMSLHNISTSREPQPGSHSSQPSRSADGWRCSGPAWVFPAGCAERVRGSHSHALRAGGAGSPACGRRGVWRRQARQLCAHKGRDAVSRTLRWPACLAAGGLPGRKLAAWPRMVRLCWQKCTTLPTCCAVMLPLFDFVRRSSLVSCSTSPPSCTRSTPACPRATSMSK